MDPPIRTPRGEGLAVRAEGHRSQSPPETCSPLLAGGDLPQAYLVVRTSRGQGLAVRAEGHGKDRATVSLEDGPLPARGHVPQMDLSFCPWPSLSVPRGEGFAV